MKPELIEDLLASALSGFIGVWLLRWIWKEYPSGKLKILSELKQWQFFLLLFFLLSTFFIIGSLFLDQ